jgi:hypothetical protein
LPPPLDPPFERDQPAKMSGSWVGGPKDAAPDREFVE